MESGQNRKRKGTRWGQAPDDYGGGQSPPSKRYNEDRDYRRGDYRGAESRGAESRGAESRGAESRGAESRGAESRGGESRGGEYRGGEYRKGEARKADAREGEGRGFSTASANVANALQQQVLLMQRIQMQQQQQRQQSVSSILESLKGRLPFALGGGDSAVVNKVPSKFDPMGRALDDEGNVIPLVRPKYATLKINKALEKEEKIKQVYKVSKFQLRGQNDPDKNQWFDSSLKSSSNKSKKHGLRFVEAGFYLRRQQQLERYNKQKEGIDTLEIKPVQGSAESEDEVKDTVAQARLAAEQFAAGQEGTQTQRHAGDNLFNNVSRKMATAPVGDSAIDGEDETEATAAAAKATRHMVPLQRKRQDAFPELEWWDIPLVEKLPAAEVATRKLAKKWKKQERLTGWSKDVVDGTTGGSGGVDSLSTSLPLLFGLDGQEEIFPYKILEMNIGHLVEHPVPIEPIAEKDANSLPTIIFLTEKERKKMRRRRRRDREQEKRDKIRMGLIPPEPPKAKLSNLMRVLAEEAVAGPTGTEMKVKTQVKDRLEIHQSRNEARKLTAERKAEKVKAKWIQKEETSVAVQCAVFSLSDIMDKRLLYKIHQNAKQLHFSGVAILCPGVGNLVVIEGGSRAVKKYKGLMLRRIRWSQDGEIDSTADGDDNDVTDTLSNDKGCKLLWEGGLRDRLFKGWKLVPCASEAQAGQFLQEHSAELYWAMLKRYRDQSVDVL